MNIVEQAPEWAREPLVDAVHSHKGRPDGKHVGISTLAYDPSKVYQRLQADTPEEEEDDGSRAKGTLLHKALYANAPNRETEVRLHIEEADLYLHGHFDAFDSEKGELRDLKTSDLYQVTDEKLEEYRDQTSMYVACVLYGEARNEDGEWVPAKDVLGSDDVHTAIIDWWGGRGLTWGFDTIKGEGLHERVTDQLEWVEDTLVEMVAGTWTPSADVEDDETRPEAPDDLHEAILRAGHAKEQMDVAEKAYNEERERIHEIQRENSLGSRYAGPYKAEYRSASTKTELDMDRVRDAVDVAEYRDSREVATVTDPERLAEELAELGLENLKGVEIETEESLNEDRLENQLAQLDPPEESDAASFLEHATVERETRSGYTFIQRED